MAHKNPTVPKFRTSDGRADSKRGPGARAKTMARKGERRGKHALQGR